MRNTRPIKIYIKKPAFTEENSFSAVLLQIVTHCISTVNAEAAKNNWQYHQIIPQHFDMQAKDAGHTQVRPVMIGINGSPGKTGTCGPSVPL